MKRKKLLIFVLIILGVGVSVFATYSANADILPKKMANANESSEISAKLKDEYGVTLIENNGLLYTDNRKSNGTICFNFNLKAGKYYSLYMGYASNGALNQAGNGINFGLETGNFSKAECESKSTFGNVYKSATVINNGRCRTSSDNGKEVNFLKLTNTYKDSSGRVFGWPYEGCSEQSNEPGKCAVQSDNTIREVCISNLAPNTDYNVYFTVQGRYGSVHRIGFEYVETFDFSIPSIEDNKISFEFDNPYWNICEDYKYNRGLDANGISELQKVVPYCFNRTVSYDIGKSNLESMLENFLKYIKTKNVSLEFQNDLNAEKLNVAPSDNLISLKCDPFANSNSNSYSYMTSDKYNISEKTLNYYKQNGQSISSQTVCESVCQEVLTITYGPPKAVKAGACFESEVTVKSNVECKSKVITPPPSTPNQTSITIPSVACQHGGIWTGQAGPSEAFDMCVKSCDGGEYSQKCIDSCYTKTELSSDSDDIDKPVMSDVSLNFSNSKMFGSLRKVDDSNDICPDPKNYSSREDLIEAVYKYTHETINGIEIPKLRGKFSKVNGKVKWIPDAGCSWNKYAPYYFRDRENTKRTVQSDMTTRAKFGTVCWLGYDCYGYEPDEDGFKRQKTGSGCSEYCYYYGYDDSTFSKFKSLSNDEYKEALQDYNDTVDKCKTSSICDENIATFTINVANDSSLSADNPNGTSGKVIQACNSDTSPSEGEFKSSTCYSWNATRNQINSSSITGDLLMFKNLDSSCTGNGEDKDDYYTKISFPGTWTGIKHGEIIFKQPEDERKYYKHDNQYCIDYGFDNINYSWWKWSELYSKQESAKNIVDTNSLFYNILTNIRDFGKFKWKFDVSCFFAVAKSPCPPGVTDCPFNEPNNDNPGNDKPGNDKPDDGKDCPNGNCGDIEIDNFKTRSASLDNLFVGTSVKNQALKLNSIKKGSLLKLDGSNKYLRATRTVRFNWRNEATDLSLCNYSIAPTAVIAMIQDMGDDVYNKEEELDYSITLSSRQIREIRKLNADRSNSSTSQVDRGGYNKWWSNEDQNAYKIDSSSGISFYQSPLLKNDSTYVTINKRPNSYGCNNLKNGNCNVNYNGYATNADYVVGISSGLSNQKSFTCRD